MQRSVNRGDVREIKSVTWRKDKWTGSQSSRKKTVNMVEII